MSIKKVNTDTGFFLTIHFSPRIISIYSFNPTSAIGREFLMPSSRKVSVDTLTLSNILALGLASRTVAGLISDLWLKFSHVLGSVTNRIILSVIFFIFLTPIALIYRLFAANPLQLSRDKSGESMYHERNNTFRKEDLEKMW
ncbi:MAG TPA: SxtJ family membrane protein [Spirochaetota bacterium]|nr:SxtJ family membrane protein [Spirochaetota bacterium]HNT11685.1 SxtJ family membrane protein [Spirochaetota bacterium]